MAPRTLGVVGAGTMGAGIAQLGCQAGMETYLHDPVPGALEQGAEKLRAGLAKSIDKGRADASAPDLLRLAADMEGLGPCELVIEAAPERPELKRQLFTRLSEVCPDAVLATNTSSIPVTVLASAAARPEQVVGMHFFNPAPLMRLLEVIAADQTSERTLETARAAGEAMGKRVILATDGPGFLVNRCGRPFYTEALRLLQERVATHEQIDRICRLGGGFRMGPFELMDLVGIDTGLEVAKSFQELSFGEPRWRPNPIQARMVAAGRLGRKAGRGYYDYSGDDYRPADPDPPPLAGGDGRHLLVRGDGQIAKAIRERAERAGFAVDAETPELIVDPAAGQLELLGDQRMVRFGLTPPVGSLVELAGEPRAQIDELLGCLGLVTEWVDEAPGLVLERIVCQLVNEAAFSIGEGVGSAEDVDAGLTLGLNHPRGPVQWGSELGIERVVATLDGLWEERREERYRPAPLLRRWVRDGMPR